MEPTFQSLACHPHPRPREQCWSARGLGGPCPTPGSVPPIPRLLGAYHPLSVGSGALVGTRMRSPPLERPETSDSLGEFVPERLPFLWENLRPQCTTQRQGTIPIGGGRGWRATPAFSIQLVWGDPKETSIIWPY